MPRRVRVEFAGAVYHVMARGNERREIFRDDHDRNRFLETLAEMIERFGVQLHAYCLMPNHYHLLVQTPRANLSQSLAWTQTTYTVRFNRRHRRSGHLFQGRFKAQLVDAEEYGRWLVRYLHYNPVRPRNRRAPMAAERKADLDSYRWSSHRAYAGLEPPAPWLCVEWLRLWGTTRKQAQQEYRREMGTGFGQPVSSPWEELRGGLVLGTEDLWRRAKQVIERKEADEELRWTKSEGANEVRERVQGLVAGEEDARVRIWARVRLGGERGRRVAQEYGYGDSSGVTQVVKRLEATAQREDRLRRRLEELRHRMSNVND